MSVKKNRERFSDRIDKNNKIVIEAKYDVAQEFRKGRAVVGVFTVVGKIKAGLALGGACYYFEIDKNGNVVK